MNYENTPILDWHMNTMYKRDDAFSALGLIPTFVFSADPRPAFEQFDERYIGGWNAMLPGKFKIDEKDYLHYPGDPPLPPVAAAMLRDENIIVYPYSLVAIIQRDGSFSIARMS